MIAKSLLPIALALAGGLGANAGKKAALELNTQVNASTANQNQNQTPAASFGVSNAYKAPERLPFVSPRPKNKYSTGEMSRFKQQKQFKKYSRKK